MSSRIRKPPADKLEALALALARGVSVRQWCRETKVPPRTAYHWSTRPEVKAKAAALRGELVNRAVARLSRGAVKASATLLKLLKATDDKIKLGAAGKIISALIELSDHRNRLGALERLAARLFGGPGWRWVPAGIVMPGEWPTPPGSWRPVDSPVLEIPLVDDRPIPPEDE